MIGKTEGDKRVLRPVRAMKMRPSKPADPFFEALPGDVRRIIQATAIDWRDVEKRKEKDKTEDTENYLVVSVPIVQVRDLQIDITGEWTEGLSCKTAFKNYGVCLCVPEVVTHLLHTVIIEARKNESFSSLFGVVVGHGIIWIFQPENKEIRTRAFRDLETAYNAFPKAHLLFQLNASKAPK